MIAALRARVANRPHSAPGMGCDHGDQQRYARWRRGWRVEKRVKRERPCQNSQRGFLAAYPKRTGHWRIASDPVLDRTPEGLWKTIVAAQCVCSSQGIDEQKSRRLEDEFKIAVIFMRKLGLGSGCKSHLCPWRVGRDFLARNGVLKPLRRKSTSK